MNICRKDHNSKTKRYLMVCLGCNVERMGHYGDWCKCSNPEFSLSGADFQKELSKMSFKGLEKLWWRSNKAVYSGERTKEKDILSAKQAITNALNQQRLQIVEMVEIVKFNAKAPDDTLAMTPVERGMWYKAYYQACTDIINKIEFLTKLEK